jgi:hypothetical protein
VTTTGTSFPLSKHTGGGGATPQFSGQCVYLQFMWEVPHPPSAVEFSSHCHFHKLSCSKVAGRGLPLLPSLANLFIYCSMRDCPFPPLWHSRHPALFATCLFCCCLFGFFSFSCFPGWESACPGVYADLAQDCLWEYHVPITSPGGLRLLSW